MIKVSEIAPALPLGTTLIVRVEPSGTMRGSMAAHPAAPLHGALLIHRVASDNPSFRMTAAA